MRILISLIAVALVTTSSIMAFQPPATKAPENKPPAPKLVEKRAQKPAKKPPFSIDVAIPLRNKSSRIRINSNSKSINNIRSHFNVVLTNNTDKPIKLWQEWCSWGYYNLSFEIIDATGKKHTLTKGDMVWTANFPDTLTIPPHKHRVIDVYFDPTPQSGVGSGWKMDSLLKAIKVNRNNRDIKMRPVFQIMPDNDSKEHKVWTGSIKGEYQEYNIFVARNAKPS